MNESTWVLGVGRLGDITSHPPVYIGMHLWRQWHHSINTSSIKKFCNAWMSLHDRRNSGEKLVQESQVKDSSEKLGQKTNAENSGEKFVQETRARSQVGLK